MIITKSEEVYFSQLTPAMAYMLYKLEQFHRRNVGPDLVITAMANGTHMTGSKHYTNEAMDIRSHNFLDTDSKLDFARDFGSFLGPKFTVILESIGQSNEHFHVQVKRGGTYP